MKLEIEIPEDWMIKQLQEDCEICLSSSLPEKMHLIREHDIVNLLSAIETCEAINKVIKYYGGSPVILAEVRPYKWKGNSDGSEDSLEN